MAYRDFFRQAKMRIGTEYNVRQVDGNIRFPNIGDSTRQDRKSAIGIFCYWKLFQVLNATGLTKTT